MYHQPTQFVGTVREFRVQRKYKLSVRGPRVIICRGRNSLGRGPEHNPLYLGLYSSGGGRFDKKNGMEVNACASRRGSDGYDKSGNCRRQLIADMSKLCLI